MNWKTLIPATAAALMLAVACFPVEKPETIALSHEQLPAQTFMVNVDRDTLLTGLSGTQLFVPKYVFVYESGQPVEGTIELELREGITMEEIVLGNLNTTSEGKPLESGGMIFVNATADGENLNLANGAALQVAVPTDSVKPEMQLFAGVETRDGLDWIDPQPLLETAMGDSTDQPVVEAEDWTATTDDEAEPSGLKKLLSSGPADAPEQFAAGLNVQFAQAESGPSAVQEVAADSSAVAEDGTAVTQMPAPVGVNRFVSDSKTHYILSMKQLGWVNIDCFYGDPRRQPVDLKLTVTDPFQYDKIFSNLIFHDRKVMLPGYQKADESFGFSHGDYEQQQLPVGAMATILFTAYHDGVPYFAMETIQIQKEQTINLDLSETTAEALKETIRKRI